MRLHPFSLELTTALGTAHGPIERREGFVVTVDPASDDVPAPDSVPDPAPDSAPDSDPISGVGEATPLPGWTESLSVCEAALDGARRSAAGETLDDALTRLDPTETPAAHHGLALALADAAARNVDRSLAEYLAAANGLPTPAETVPVNATIGDAGPDATAREAKRAIADGFGCLKVKVGARDLDADVERLRAIRRAVGPDVVLRADANGAWDRETARRALDRLAQLDLAYVEQPLPADDLDGTAALRAAARNADSGDDVPIALDESLASHDLDTILAADAADVVILKPMALGGPGRALSTAMHAREAGVEPVVTTTIDAVVARTAAVHVAAAIPDVAPCGLATGSLLAEDLAADPCSVSEGYVTVPTADGLAGHAFGGFDKFDGLGEFDGFDGAQ